MNKLETRDKILKELRIDPISMVNYSDCNVVLKDTSQLIKIIDYVNNELNDIFVSTKDIFVSTELGYIKDSHYWVDVLPKDSSNTWILTFRVFIK